VPGGHVVSLLNRFGSTFELFRFTGIDTFGPVTNDHVVDPQMWRIHRAL
jgi:hypothetical protein